MRHRYIQLFFILAVACQSASPKQNHDISSEQIPAVIMGETENLSPMPPAVSSKDWKTQLPTQLTRIGENYNGSFSPDGQKVVYLSSKRTQHTHAQAYELSLTTQKERRITHQDGWIAQIRYIPGVNKFIYSSTTDEIKEDLGRLIQEISNPSKPQFSFEDLETNPYIENLGQLPFEIYISELDGSGIQRVTESEGFDSIASASPTLRVAAFTSFRTGDGELYQWSYGNKTIQRLTIANGTDLQPSYSPDGKQLAWIHQTSPNSNLSSIWISSAIVRQPKPLFRRPAVYLNPVWYTDNKTILFSSNFEDEKNLELYAYNLDTKCIKRLTVSEGSDKEPAISLDGKKIIFTSNRGGSHQIYMMDLVLPEPCITIEN